MSCEGKPEMDVYRRFLEGHQVRRSEAEGVAPFVKGDLAAFRVQNRLAETELEGGDSLILLEPRISKGIEGIADNLR